MSLLSKRFRQILSPKSCSSEELIRQLLSDEIRFSRSNAFWEAILKVNISEDDIEHSNWVVSCQKAVSKCFYM